MTRPGPKGSATREHILATALKLFRKRGFEGTTMRDIAQAADLSLGAAYHYFPSKEALVLAYYEWMQEEHERLMEAAGDPGADLRARVGTLLRTKLDLLHRDRKLLATLFGNLGDPAHSLSVFGEKSASVRQRSVKQFTEVFAPRDAPPPLRPFLGQALWLSHLGLFLFFIHDRSPQHARTQKLLEAIVELTASGVPLLTHPLAAPVRGWLLQLMTDLGAAREEKP
ncbi:TetR/AcrR family transcriptional regulator [Melittangium boletus]|uniref:TetR/AcrR family transcriptional regulator n=1 Tax=Melittangium boletus TaxID=83453 RepID=UPI003DA3B212